MRDLPDAADIMDAIAAALKARDLQAASDLLHLLALTDPGAAQAIHDWITDVAGRDAGGEQSHEPTDAP